jgi:hypothetical protein
MYLKKMNPQFQDLHKKTKEDLQAKLKGKMMEKRISRMSNHSRENMKAKFEKNLDKTREDKENPIIKEVRDKYKDTIKNLDSVQDKEIENANNQTY